MRQELKKVLDKTLHVWLGDSPEYAESAGTDGCRHDELLLFEEVDKLCRKVHKLESDNSSLRASLAEKRRLEEESKNIIAFVM